MFLFFQLSYVIVNMYLVLHIAEHLRKHLRIQRTLCDIHKELQPYLNSY